MKDYVRELRARVGTRPLILPGTSILLTDPDDRVLLIERADLDGWSLPGGLMEPGESFEDTGRREVFEEIGIKIDELALLDVFSGPEYYYRFEHGDEVYNVTAAYLTALPTHATFALDPAEARSARFFHPTDVPDTLITPERPIVTRYQQWLTQR